MRLKKWVVPTFVIINLVIIELGFGMMILNTVNNLKEENTRLKEALNDSDVEKAFLIAENMDLQNYIDYQKEMYESK